MPSGPISFEQVVARATPLSPDEFNRWGAVLVVAPHPDDESLGCGGAIAHMCRRGQPVQVLFISDGTMSHPNSQRYSAEVRRDLREQEARNALAILGVDPAAITFLRLPDTQVPTSVSAASFERATSLVHHQLHRLRPRTVLIPWRRDPHGDHRATWQLLQAAVARVDYPIRWIEYPIWVWETTNPDDLPTTDDGVWYALDVTEALSQKREAIAAHVSQTTQLIDDDPDGFTLSPEMISHFTQPHEYYLIP